MKAFEEYRTKRIDEWNNQKKRRLELRCGKYLYTYMITYIISIISKIYMHIYSFLIYEHIELNYCIINIENKQYF